eukprot:scaffold14006_cov114-Isochrysis_galbana.AAC.2
MSISSYASNFSAASQPLSQYFTQSTPSRQSGMIQPVVQEMFATVHAAGSSLFALFSSCSTFDSTKISKPACEYITVSALKNCKPQAGGRWRVVNPRSGFGRHRATATAR